LISGCVEDGASDACRCGGLGDGPEPSWRSACDARGDRVQREADPRAREGVLDRWTNAGERSYTFIVFSGRTQAEAFAADVRGNAENQASNGVRNLSLDVHEIVAQT